MEVAVDRLVAVLGVALNSYKLGVGHLNVDGEANCVAVCRRVVVVPDRLNRMQFYLLDLLPRNYTQ